MGEHELRVHQLPRDVAKESLAGSVVVVIDLLRASSTICQAIASEARDVVPFLEIDETLAAADAVRRTRVVLGGERKGTRISGFDLGNSPAEYTPEAVRGRRVFITTTNGTRALDHAGLAKRVLVGALVNLSAVVQSIKDEPRVDILCAGTDGGATREDILAAGALTSRLTEWWGPSCRINEQAAAAQREWDEVVARATSSGRPLNEQLTIELRDSQGGRNLLDIGLERDLVDCAQIDRLSVVPQLDIRHWRIT